MTHRGYPFSQSVPTGIYWILLAGLVGIAVATKSYPIVLIGSVTVTLVLLSFLTPIAALIVLLVLAPMRTLIATEARFQLPLDIGQIALISALAIYIMFRVARGRDVLRYVWTPLSLPLFIFILVTGLSAYGALSLGAWLSEWLKWLQVLVLVVLTVNLVLDNQWEWIIFGIVVSGVANALVGIYQFFGGSGALHLVINDRYFRAFGTFGQPNPFGGFMGLVAPLALMACVGYAIRAWTYYRLTQTLSPSLLTQTSFYAVSSLLIFIGIGMSWSRGAWLGLAGAMGIVALALPRHTWRGILVLVVGLSVVAVLWLTGYLPISIVERLNSSTSEYFASEDVRGVDITPENFAVVERLAHWQAALNMATVHPILGVGFGNYEVAYPYYRLLNWSEPLGHAHNYYLNILAEVGVLGFLGYGKVWLSIIRITWQARKHPDIFARLVVIGLLGSWVYLSIHSIFDDLYVNNLFLHLGLMLGLLAVLYNQTETGIRLHTNDQYPNITPHDS